MQADKTAFEADAKARATANSSSRYGQQEVCQISGLIINSEETRVRDHKMGRNYRWSRTIACSCQCFSSSSLHVVIQFAERLPEFGHEHVHPEAMNDLMFDAAVLGQCSCAVFTATTWDSATTQHHVEYSHSSLLPSSAVESLRKTPGPKKACKLTCIH